ncbi:MAG TPA: AAA family ATPase, partial [Thiotrichales bacterium]|nr:AAA family ATPase [Thiotrichales bacterium]
MNDLSENDFQQAKQDLQQLQAKLESAIVGQGALISQLLITFMAGGH